jgi:hypothetical protein
VGKYADPQHKSCTAKCNTTKFCSATDTVGLSVPQEQGMWYSAKEASVIEQA